MLPYNCIESTYDYISILIKIINLSKAKKNQVAI